ncbi:ATP-binding cassette domain-containing protein [Paenibacillus sp. FSL R7-0198]|uniref:ATP-binding cassette domain-containing protein n=1 Tax=Paenibacillus sp. FSL R7-0198 TaxID=2921674 RepID=UPI0030F4EA01
MLLARDIVVSYGKKGGEVVVLRALNLDVSAGKVIGIEGDSKSGKSTLASVLVGDLQPKYGEVQKGKLKSILINGTKRTSNMSPLLIALEQRNLGLLIIDDAETSINRENISLVLNQKLFANRITILLSSNLEVYKDCLDTTFRLESGRLVLKK